VSVNVFKVEKICSRLKDIAFLVEQIALLHRMSKLKTDEYLKALEDSLAKIEKEHSDNIGVFNDLIKCGFDGLVLTVKDVEQCVKQASFVVYSALNLAFNNYSVQEQNLVLNFM
jgi:hypothetical protein